MISGKDYSETALTISQAMREVEAQQKVKLREPVKIVWGGKVVSKYLWFDVPVKGWLELRLLSYVDSPMQGFDILVPDGKIFFEDGSYTYNLRTWCSRELPDVMRYRYESPQGRLCTGNVFSRRFDGDDEPFCEKGLPNSGVMLISDASTILIRASDGVDDIISFDDLSYEIVVSE